MTQKDREQIESMLTMGAAKNKDGFGLFDDNGKIFRNSSAYSGRFGPGIDQAFKESTFIVAHNRLATHGMTKKRNTHPFSSKSLIWVHNGVISNYQELAKEYGLKNILVDSEVIGLAIENELRTGSQIKQAIKKVAERLEGNFSVFVYHKPSKRLFYFRHDAEFTFRLLELDGSKIIAGSSVGENLNCLYSQSSFGFPIPQARILAEKEPADSTIYELDKALGLLKIDAFKPKEPTTFLFQGQSFAEFGEPSEFEVKRLGNNRYKLVGNDSVIKEIKEYFGHLFLDKEKAILQASALEELMESIY